MKYIRCFVWRCIPVLLVVLSVFWSTLSSAAIGGAKVSVIVQSMTQDVRIVLYNFLGEQEIGKAVISDDFQFMGKQARVKVFPAGLDPASPYVRIELIVEGNYENDVSKSLCGVLFEHLHFKAGNSFKPVVDIGLADGGVISFSEAEAEETGGQQNVTIEQQADHFILICNRVMTVASLKELPDRALFNIHPLSAGDLTEFHQNKTLTYTWSMPKSDLTRIKRGKGILKGQKAEVLDMCLELGNRHTVSRLTHISYAFTANPNELHGRSAECYYLEKSGNRVRLGSHHWGVELEPFTGRESADPFVSYKNVIRSSGTAMCAKFQIVLTRDTFLENPRSSSVQSTFRQLLDAPVGSVAIDHDKNCNLMYVSLLNFDSLGAQVAARGAFSPQEGEQYTLALHPHGSAAEPEHMSLLISPAQQGQCQWLTSLQGCVVYYIPVSAREDLHHSCARYVEKSSQPAPHLYTPILPLGNVNKAANCEYFIIQPIAGLQVSTDSGVCSTPFVSPESNSTSNYLVSCQRHELALTHNGFVALNGGLTDQPLKFQLTQKSSSLQFEVEGIDEAFADGTASLFTSSKQGRSIAWTPVGDGKPKSIKTKSGARSLSFKLGAVARVLSQAQGESIQLRLEMTKPEASD